jgi:hypothetical protein
MIYTSPHDWQKTIIISIFKKGDRKNCNSYWGTSLLLAAHKSYAKIITRRLNGISEVLLSKEQHGFRKGSSCMDCILAIKQIIKKDLNLTRKLIYYLWTMSQFLTRF